MAVNDEVFAFLFKPPGLGFHVGHGWRNRRILAFKPYYDVLLALTSKPTGELPRLLDSETVKDYSCHDYLAG